MGAAYSSLGRTKYLYATSVVHVLLGTKAKFPRRKPSVLVALDFFKCVEPKTVLTVMVIPRYFAD